MKNNIGNFIAQKRKEMGYTQQELAKHLHVSFQAVSKWENGTTTPDIALLPQIAQFFRTSVDALLGYNSFPATEYEEHYKQKEFENPPWYSGELFKYYHNWLFHKNDEKIFDCNSGGTPHQHCMDILIAEKIQ